MAQPTVSVIGDGWAALGSAAFLGQAGFDVRWIGGSGGRILAPLPSMDAGPGAHAWHALASRLGIEAGALQTGSFLREFRNKGFREAVWTQAPTPEMRRDARDESLWSAERRLAPAFEARFDLTLGELEEAVRERTLALPNVKRTEGVPVSSIKFGEEKDAKLAGVVLASGLEVPCDLAIFADRWSTLPGIEGLPKGLSFARGRDPVGVLQASFTHSSKIAAGVREGFFSALHREAGEELQRHVWGYFFENAPRSLWTILIASNEAEDNHEITKKLRRLKQALDKMFIGGEWLPDGANELMSTVVSEQVRFEESILFAEGRPPEETHRHPKAPGVVFLTDGYGPASSLEQCARALRELVGLDIPEGPQPEAESVELAGSGPVK